MARVRRGSRSEWHFVAGPFFAPYVLGGAAERGLASSQAPTRVAPPANGRALARVQRPVSASICRRSSRDQSPLKLTVECFTPWHEQGRAAEAPSSRVDRRSCWLGGNWHRHPAARARFSPGIRQLGPWHCMPHRRCCPRGQTRLSHLAAQQTGLLRDGVSRRPTTVQQPCRMPIGSRSTPNAGWARGACRKPIPHRVAPRAHRLRNVTRRVATWPCRSPAALPNLCGLAFPHVRSCVTPSSFIPASPPRRLRCRRGNPSWPVPGRLGTWTTPHAHAPEHRRRRLVGHLGCHRSRATTCNASRTAKRVRLRFLATP